MAKDFMEKKNLIMKKLDELKKQNKNIDDIYKYTDEIIFEEEDEDEDEEEQEQNAQNKVSDT